MAIGDGGWFLFSPNVTQQLLFCAKFCFSCPLAVDGKNQARVITGDV